MNKKASVEDVIFLMGIMLAIVFALILVAKISNEMHNSGKFDLTPEAAEAFDEIDTNFFGHSLDFVILAVFLGTFLSILTLALFLRTSPLFWVFGFIITLIGSIISYVISNVWDKVQTAEQLSVQISNIPFGNFILNWMPILYPIMSFTTMIILYGLASKLSGDY